MKNVLFIQPPFERIMGYKRFYTHPGLLSLAAVVEQAGHRVKVYDADYDPGNISLGAMELMERYEHYIKALSDDEAWIWEEISNVILRFAPDVLCVTILTVTQDSARRVIEIAKELYPDLLVITGGVHPTINPMDCIPYSDYVICNEGEDVILDAIKGDIPKGVVFGSRILELDRLPFPAIHTLHNLSRYEKRDLSMVISTRGCPNQCKFCCSPLIWNGRVTRKSVDYFIQELKILIEEYQINDFFISDDSFTYDKKWLKEFCIKIRPYQITFRCLGRIDMIDEDIIDMLTKAGCRNIKLGIESGSQRILDMVNKKIRLEDIRRADRILSRSKLDWSAFFIIGFPSETASDIRMTQELIMKLSAKSVTLSMFTPYPGTELYSDHNRVGAKYYSHHSPYNNFTGTMSNRKFISLVRETNMLVSRKKYAEH